MYQPCQKDERIYQRVRSNVLTRYNQDIVVTWEYLAIRPHSCHTTNVACIPRHVVSLSLEV